MLKIYAIDYLNKNIYIFIIISYFTYFKMYKAFNKSVVNPKYMVHFKYRATYFNGKCMSACLSFYFCSFIGINYFIDDLLIQF